jgi:hypothetical protein
MAIVVLVLWLFTAGAGFYLLVTSNLGRARPAPAAPVPAAPASAAPAPSVSAAEPATASVAAPATPRATTTEPASAAQPQPATTRESAPATSQPASTAQAAAAAPASKREMRRAARDRFDPPSLVAAKSAPAVPGLRPLLEFAHPASAIVGLGFWLAYTFVHYRALGWIAFGLVTATVCLGLTWFTANRRAATRPARPARPTRPARSARHGIPAGPSAQGAPDDDPPPSFSGRLVVLHGGAAAVTFALAALTAFALGR